MSSSRNIVESCYLGVWLFHDNAPQHESLVAQQALCDCEFVQPNHSAYSLDLAPSDYSLIRNLNYHLRGTWFTADESLTIAMSRHGLKVKTKNSYFQCLSNWEDKLKKCIDVVGKYVEKLQYIWCNILIFISKLQNFLIAPRAWTDINSFGQKCCYPCIRMNWIVNCPIMK